MPFLSNFKATTLLKNPLAIIGGGVYLLNIAHSVKRKRSQSKKQDTVSNTKPSYYDYFSSDFQGTSDSDFPPGSAPGSMKIDWFGLDGFDGG